MDSLTPSPTEVNPMSDAARTEPKGYNGWTNYPTWAVCLWMDNERGSYEAAREQARETLRDLAVPDYLSDLTLREYAAWLLADELKDEYERAAEDAIPQGTVWADLIGSALGDVNWREIALHLVDEVSVADAE